MFPPSARKWGSSFVYGYSDRNGVELGVLIRAAERAHLVAIVERAFRRVERERKRISAVLARDYRIGHDKIEPVAVARLRRAVGAFLPRLWSWRFRP